MAILQIYNGARPTTAVLPAVATGTAVKTMLQVLVNRKYRVIEWGISHAGASTVRMQAELLTTGTVAATITAAVDADIVRISDPDSVAMATLGFTFSTTGTGYWTAGGPTEGSITATSVYDHQQVLNQYVKQYPLGREPVINHDDVLRIRVDSDTDVNATCYVTIEI